MIKALTRRRLNVPEVHRLIHAQQNMLAEWSEMPPGGPERKALWTELHRAGDDLHDLAYGGPTLWMRWRYWIRPFDMLADRRRWAWQPRQPCGLGGVSPETERAVRAAFLHASGTDDQGEP